MDYRTAEAHKNEVAFEVPIDIKQATTSISKNLDHQHSSMFLSILSRFHAGYFRISLSLGWQALLWKTLLDTSKDPSNNTMNNNIPPKLLSIISIIIWSFAFITLTIISFLYILRCFFRFNMVKQEFLNHVGVNYLYAPWISWLLILESFPLPREYITNVVLWFVFALPIVVLDIKIYGQWFTKGKKFLTIVANPTSQLSIIGNLVGSRAASQMGWKESSVFLFSVGMVHYLVLFVTLYQRLSGSEKLPASLRPVFFLFSAAPSMACLAWDSVSGGFDTASKMLFCLSLFLFTSLICRPSLFRKSMRRYNVAWWAYSYPITLLAQASAVYAREVEGGLHMVIIVILSILSVLIILGLLGFTALNYKLMLLPDDDPILITNSIRGNSANGLS